MQRASVTTRRVAFLRSVDVDENHPTVRPSLTGQSTLPPPPPLSQVDEDDDDPDFKRATSDAPSHRVQLMLFEIKRFSLRPARDRSETIEVEEIEDEFVNCELLFALNWRSEAVVVSEGFAPLLSDELPSTKRRLFVLVKLVTKQMVASMLKWLRSQLFEHIERNNSIDCRPLSKDKLLPWKMFHVHLVHDWSNLVSSLWFHGERQLFHGQAVDMDHFAFFENALCWAAGLATRGESIRSDDPFLLAHVDFSLYLILLFDHAQYKQRLTRAHASDSA